MTNSSLLNDGPGFVSSVASSLALQGAFERISCIPASTYVETSDWGDSDGGGFEDSDYRDCPAG